MAKNLTERNTDIRLIEKGVRFDKVKMILKRQLKSSSKKAIFKRIKNFLTFAKQESPAYRSCLLYNRGIATYTRALVRLVEATNTRSKDATTFFTANETALDPSRMKII